jgi:hypothetical protein
MTTVRYASAYSYDPSNNVPGQFIEDDCEIETFEDYDSYFALKYQEDEPKGFEEGTWRSPIMPRRTTGNWTVHDDDNGYDDQWGEFHGFPLSSEDAALFEIAHLKELKTIPFAFSCANHVLLKMRDLYECPCFLLSLQPEVGSEEYIKLLSFANHGSEHDCTTCTWCLCSPKLHPDYFCLVSGFTFQGHASAGILPWATHIPKGFPLKIESFGIRPDEDQTDIYPRKMLATVKFSKHRPDPPICGLSPRLLTSVCCHGCQSPYDHFRKKRSLSCLSDYDLKRPRDWGDSASPNHSSDNRYHNVMLVLAAIHALLLSIILWILLVRSPATVEVVLRYPGAT